MVTRKDINAESFSTIVLKTSPDGTAEYMLRHPGSPKTASLWPRPALKPSKAGRKVHFPQKPELLKVYEEGDMYDTYEDRTTTNRRSTHKSQSQQPHSRAGADRQRTLGSPSKYHIQHYSTCSNYTWNDSLQQSTNCLQQTTAACGCPRSVSSCHADQDERTKACQCQYHTSSVGENPQKLDIEHQHKCKQDFQLNKGLPSACCLRQHARQDSLGVLEQQDSFPGRGDEILVHFNEGDDSNKQPSQGQHYMISKRQESAATGSHFQVNAHNVSITVAAGQPKPKKFENRTLSAPHCPKNSNNAAALSNCHDQSAQQSEMNRNVMHSNAEAGTLPEVRRIGSAKPVATVQKEARETQTDLPEATDYQLQSIRLRPGILADPFSGSSPHVQQRIYSTTNNNLENGQPWAHDGPSSTVNVPYEACKSLVPTEVQGCGSRDANCLERLCTENSYLEDGTTTESLSSGLSPREMHARHKEWDQIYALKALANGAESYARAAQLHKMGCGGPVTMTDALPAKLAAQQLNSLAGMSKKVQEAILQSQRIFEHQAQMVEHAVLQRSFYSWRHFHNCRALCKRRQQQILKRIQWNALRKCLHEWILIAGVQEKQKIAVQKATKLLKRTMVLRCFKEWVRQLADRRWKTQLAIKDTQLQSLVNEVRHIKNRPVRYMQKYRSKKLMHHWKQYAQCQKGQTLTWKVAVGHDVKRTQLKFLFSWFEASMWLRSKEATAQHAARLLQRSRLQKCMHAWRKVIGHREFKQLKHYAASAHHREALQRRALGGWRYISGVNHVSSNAAMQQLSTIQNCVFKGWRQCAMLLCAERELLQALSARRSMRQLELCLYSWLGFVDGKRVKMMEAEIVRLTCTTGKLQLEKDFLKQDNERLGRVIDSGDWGKCRVEELLEAGKVLKQERDALLEMVKSLRTQEHGSYCISTDHVTGEKQQPGIQLVTRSLSPNNSPPPSPGLRNKLLVKTGSSFNAMVRALKQDLINSGTLVRNPTATYKVDHLSLNRVRCSDGGKFDIDVLSSPTSNMAFGRGQNAAAAVKQTLLKSSNDNLFRAAQKMQNIGGRSVQIGRRYS